MKIKVRLIGNGWPNKGAEVDAEITHIKTTYDGVYWNICKNYEIEPVKDDTKEETKKSNVTTSLIGSIGATPKTIAIEF